MDPPATSSGLAHVWLLDYELELGLVIRRGPATGPAVADLITGPAAALSLLAGFQRLDPGDLFTHGHARWDRAPGATGGGGQAG